MKTHFSKVRGITKKYVQNSYYDYEAKQQEKQKELHVFNNSTTTTVGTVHNLTLLKNHADT